MSPTPQWLPPREPKKPHLDDHYHLGFSVNSFLPNPKKNHQKRMYTRIHSKRLEKLPHTPELLPNIEQLKNTRARSRAAENFF